METSCGYVYVVRVRVRRRLLMAWGVGSIPGNRYVSRSEGRFVDCCIGGVWVF